MEYVGADVRQLMSPEWWRVPENVRGRWLQLVGFCAFRENGDTIRDAKAWTNRDWGGAGLTKNAVQSVVKWGWARFDGADLVVLGYPKEVEARLRRRRASAKHAADARWGDAESLGSCDASASVRDDAGDHAKRSVAKRIEAQRTGADALDLEAIYQAYPKKVGKKDGCKKLRTKVQDEGTYTTVLSAAQEMGRLWSGEDLTYCPGFAPWVNQERWQDDSQQGPSRDGRAAPPAPREIKI